MESLCYSALEGELRGNSYSSCSFLHTYLSKASKQSIALHPAVTGSSFIHPCCITSPTKHTPPSSHQAVNTRTPCADVSLISQPQKRSARPESSLQQAPAAEQPRSWLATGDQQWISKWKNRKKLSDLKHMKIMIVFFSGKICIYTENCISHSF